MVVGKTHPSFDFDIHSLDETDILASCFSISKIPCVISSPFRQDNHPSFAIYLDNKDKVKFIDYSTKESGNLWDFLKRLWSCDYHEAVEKVCASFQQNLHIQKIITQSSLRKAKGSLSRIDVRIRAWKDYDIAYWNSYGVSLRWLKKAEVYPISHETITYTDKKTKQQSQFTFSVDKYAYAFIERKEGNLQIKIYQPYNTKGFKWCSKMDGSVVSLWTTIPEYGDKVIICSSLKDALCVRTQLGIPTLALQGEGYNISTTAINELKRRYKKIFISFDTDNAGIQDSKTLAEKTGFINIIPDLGKQKDFSDYYKALNNKEDFQKINSLFN